MMWEAGYAEGIAESTEVDWATRRHFLLFQALEVLASAYASASEIGFVDEEILRQWRRWAHSWSAREETADLIVPLARCHLDGESSILIAPGVHLEVLTPEMKQKLWDSSHEVFGILSLDGFSAAQTVIRVAGEARARKSDSGREIEMASMAIRALRLSVSGTLTPIGSVRVVRSPVISRPMALLQPREEYSMLTVARPHREAIVRPSSRSLIASTYVHLERLSKVKGYGGCELGLRRFEQAYTRAYPEDVVVDLVIGLESLLLADATTELRYKFALRGAALLRSAERSADIYQRLQALYDVRSSVVHSGQSVGESKPLTRINAPPLASFLHEAEDLARTLIAAFVLRCADSRGAKQLANELDAEILSCLSATTL
jgi:hypothetical protein